MTTPATKYLNSRSFFSSSNAQGVSKTPTKNSSHEVERFNFTIEAKRKQSIIQKIENLIPFLDGLINKTQVRSNRMVERLFDLKDHIDDIFEQINEEFENANMENQQLREALDRRRPGAHGGNPELERRVSDLLEQLRILKQQKLQTQDRLFHAENQTVQAYDLLAEMKNEVERIKKGVPSSDRQNYQLRKLRDDLERVRSQPTSIDEGTRRRLDQYQNRLREENRKFRDLQNAYESLARKSNLDEQELNKYRRNIDDRTHNAPIDQEARRRLRDFEEGNNQLKRRVQMSNQQLNNKMRQIKKLEEQNAERYQQVKEFKRLSDLGGQEIRRLKSQFQNERRQSIINQEDLVRKLRALDQEKSQLLRQAKANQDKARDYEKVVSNLEREFQNQRRNSLVNDRQKQQKIRFLQRQNAELGTQYKVNKQKLGENQNRLRQLQNGIREKERKLQDYINQLTKKSNLNQDQMRMLNQQLQKQRRRTLADEGRIRNLQSTIEDQKEKAKVQIKKLQAALEEERRKSFADQNKIKNLQRILNEKVHLINQNADRNILAKDQIQFLKNEIQKQRRNSMADQDKIRKLQNLLQQKQTYFKDINNRHSIAEKDIQKLQKIIQQERRKSTADEAKIKKLQSILADKMKQANQTHNKYLDMVRKSDMGDQQIKALMNQLQNERRKSNADQARIKNIQQLLQQRQKQIKDQRNMRGDFERQIGFLKNQIDEERRKSMADQEKIRKLQQMRQQKEKLLADYNKRHQDQMRITDVNAEQIKFLKAQLDKQRRKSDADENTIRNLKKVIEQKEKIAADHKNKHLNQIRFLQQEIDSERKKSFADQAKIRKLQELLSAKLKEEEAQKRALAELMRKSDLNENELKLIKQVLDEERRKSTLDQNLIRKLEAVIKDQMGQIKQKDDSFIGKNRQIEEIKAALQKQRKNSFVNEATIRKMQALLKQKTDQATNQYKKYLQTLRKSELNEEQLRFLKQQMDKQRRQSSLAIQGYDRRVKDLENVKQNLSGKLDEDRKRLADTANYIKDLEEKSGNIERMYKDAAKKNSFALEELDKYKQEIDKERRKSTALEGKFLPKIHELVEQNKRLVLQIKNQKQGIEQGERKSRQLLSELDKTVSKMNQLQNHERNQRETIDKLQRQLGNQDQQARRVIEQGVAELKSFQSQLQRTRAEKDKLESELGSKQKQTSALKQILHQAEQQLRSKSQQLSEQVNNNQSMGALLNDIRRKEKELQERNEELVRQNAQNSIVYESHLQGYLSGVPVRVSHQQIQPLQPVVNSIVSESDHREREHVIRVLKHESKVYRLQTVLNRKFQGELSDTSLDERY